MTGNSTYMHIHTCMVINPGHTDPAYVSYGVKKVTCEVRIMSISVKVK